MDHLQKYIAQVRTHLFVILLANNAFIIGAWWWTHQYGHLPDTSTLWLLIACAAILTLGFALLSTSYLTSSMKAVWQAILHIAPDTADTPKPNLASVPLGKELVASMVTHIYQLASVVSDVEATITKEQADVSRDFVAASLPLPLAILNKNDEIIFANQAMATYLGQDRQDLLGKSIYSAADMNFTNDQTFDKWLQDAKANKAVATQTWERVRLNAPDKEVSDQPQFDLASYYNKNNPQGYETMVVFFDHTNQYAQDDQAMSFIAIAVHELRTPLTLLRGYIEAFQEDLAGKVDPELEGFMKKMSVAAGQLSSFVNTILNVSRIDNNQLELQLHKETWNDIVQSSVNTMFARAEIRGIHLEFLGENNLPEVGVDRVAITEVINNLIDNAIKYSGSSDKIIIRSHKTTEGLVETTVQDFGVGIPESAVPHLFEKFYRNHRNRAQIGGTGLGLYLAKVIVGAHDGHIWVRSHEGQGTTFGFTVRPYAQVAEEQKTGDNEAGDIVRSAHGWIKNHSMYRR
jgi:signal transduction histidine kinase